MIKIALHLWSLEIAIPNTISPAIRRNIYRPINQLKEKADNKIVQTGYRKTDTHCISKYRFEKHKQEFLNTIELNLKFLKLPYAIINNEKAVPHKTSKCLKIEGEIKVSYSQGTANKIATAVITLRNVPVKLNLKTKVCGMPLTSRGGVKEDQYHRTDDTLQKTLKLKLPIYSSWEELTTLCEKEVATLKQEIAQANTEYANLVDPIPSSKIYTL